MLITAWNKRVGNGPNGSASNFYRTHCSIRCQPHSFDSHRSHGVNNCHNRTTLKCCSAQESRRNKTTAQNKYWWLQNMLRLCALIFVIVTSVSRALSRLNALRSFPSASQYIAKRSPTNSDQFLNKSTRAKRHAGYGGCAAKTRLHCENGLLVAFDEPSLAPTEN